MNNASRDFDWDRIETFVGFGRLDAPVVFIGIEEGLENASALPEDLRVRSTYEARVMDLKAAHREIAGTEHYFDPERAPKRPTWRVMADVMLRREGHAEPTGTDRRRYRALHLGRTHGDSLLVELLPYPHPKSHDWLYAGFGKYLTREAYEMDQIPRRITLLRDALGEHEHHLIVCYGKGRWPEFQRLFADVIFAGDELMRVGHVGRTRIVLTHHFSRETFNSGEQLAAFARVALG
jgi:hypothetical protein